MKTISREEYIGSLDTNTLWISECPFCTLKHKHTENIIWEWKYWFIRVCLSPYTWNKQHLLAIPNTHRILPSELSNEELLDMRNVHQFVEKYFWDQTYFSCLRDTMGNRSVEHLHHHFIAWKLQWKYLRSMLMNQGFPITEKL